MQMTDQHTKQNRVVKCGTSEIDATLEPGSTAGGAAPARRCRERAEAPAGQAQRAKASPGTEHLTEREGRGERGEGTAGEEGGGTERRKSEIDDKLPHRLAPRGRSRHEIGRDRIGPQSKKAGAISTRDTTW